MSAKGGSFKYVKPTRRLSDKVGTQGGVELEDALVRADQALAKVAGDFPALCEKWINSLKAAVPAHGAVDPDTRQTVLGIANDIRGQGGTFGYPLVTLVANSLVKFVDPRENSSDVDATIVQVHVQALERLIQDNVRGDGGPVGVELRTLVTALAKRRQKP
jgi:hypothetical protein